MTDKKIIIDGVDVNECAYFDYENEGTRECDAYGNECEANNCYFKQFKRKEQECNELKAGYDLLKNWYQAKYNDVKNCLSHCYKALDELEKICLEDTYTFADGTTVRYDSFDDILDIINKAKDGK